ncbi:hypothetical protein AJ79_03731 [Helicocarpus griseus UAMH5409]|uniref:Uncharacterized protein n=1 Tax=Helicocarpus griseus UAMH5409 TaxID=1447875 RepID=A0A2B7XWI9_9EURO|nr:hypothetical protein AJ79_03731 [Helicocarpus griseus UAMH5409]
MESANDSSTLRGSSEPPPSPNDDSPQAAGEVSPDYAPSSTSASLSPPPASPDQPPSIDLPSQAPRQGVTHLGPSSANSMAVDQAASKPSPPAYITTENVPVSHSVFKEIVIHTAKCDKCNNHNKSTLRRCTTCGFQICMPCWMRGSGGYHAVTRKFTGPVFDPNAVDEDEYDDEEVEKEDVVMSETPESGQAGNREVVVISDDEKPEVISIHDSDEEGAAVLRSMRDHYAPSPSVPRSSTLDLDIPFRSPQTGDAFAPLHIYSSTSEESVAGDDEGSTGLPQNENLRVRGTARRDRSASRNIPYNNVTAVSYDDQAYRDRDDTIEIISDDESEVQLSSQGATANTATEDNLYYSDLASDMREGIDALIHAAGIVFGNTTLSPTKTTMQPTQTPPRTPSHAPPPGPPRRPRRPRGVHDDSPLFVPVGPNDTITAFHEYYLACQERIRKRGNRIAPYMMSMSPPPTADGEAEAAQTMRQLSPPVSSPFPLPSLPSVAAATPQKRKREDEDVDGGEDEAREQQRFGPFVQAGNSDEDGVGRELSYH